MPLVRTTLMIDYSINGDIDGHTWLRGRYVLLVGKKCRKDIVTGGIRSLLFPAFSTRVRECLMDSF